MVEKASVHGFTVWHLTSKIRSESQRGKTHQAQLRESKEEGSWPQNEVEEKIKSLQKLVLAGYFRSLINTWKNKWFNKAFNNLQNVKFGKSMQ